MSAYHWRCWVEAFAALLPAGTVEGLDPNRRLPMFERWFAGAEPDLTAVVAETGDVAFDEHVLVKDLEDRTG